MASKSKRSQPASVGKPQPWDSPEVAEYLRRQLRYVQTGWATRGDASESSPNVRAEALAVARVLDALLVALDTKDADGLKELEKTASKFMKTKGYRRIDSPAERKALLEMLQRHIEPEHGGGPLPVNEMAESFVWRALGKASELRSQLSERDIANSRPIIERLTPAFQLILNSGGDAEALLRRGLKELGYPDPKNALNFLDKRRPK